MDKGASFTGKTFVKNLKDNDLYYEDRQVTQCAFLGVVRLKPVPSVFKRNSVPLNNASKEKDLNVTKNNNANVIENRNGMSLFDRSSIKPSDKIIETVTQVPSRKTEMSKLPSKNQRVPENTPKASGELKNLTSESLTMLSNAIIFKSPGSSVSFSTLTASKFNPVQDLIDKVKQKRDHDKECQNRPSTSSESFKYSLKDSEMNFLPENSSKSLKINPRRQMKLTDSLIKKKTSLKPTESKITIFDVSVENRSNSSQNIEETSESSLEIKKESIMSVSEEICEKPKVKKPSKSKSLLPPMLLNTPMLLRSELAPKRRSLLSSDKSKSKSKEKYTFAKDSSKKCTKSGSKGAEFLAVEKVASKSDKPEKLSKEIEKTETKSLFKKETSEIVAESLVGYFKEIPKEETKEKLEKTKKRKKKCLKAGKTILDSYASKSKKILEKLEENEDRNEKKSTVDNCLEEELKIEEKIPLKPQTTNVISSDLNSKENSEENEENKEKTTANQRKELNIEKQVDKIEETSSKLPETSEFSVSGSEEKLEENEEKPMINSEEEKNRTEEMSPASNPKEISEENEAKPTADLREEARILNVENQLLKKILDDIRSIKEIVQLDKAKRTLTKQPLSMGERRSKQTSLDSFVVVGNKKTSKNLDFSKIIKPSKCNSPGINKEAAQVEPENKRQSPTIEKQNQVTLSKQHLLSNDCSNEEMTLLPGDSKASHVNESDESSLPSDRYDVPLSDQPPSPGNRDDSSISEDFKDSSLPGNEANKRSSLPRRAKQTNMLLRSELTVKSANVKASKKVKKGERDEETAEESILKVENSKIKENEKEGIGNLSKVDENEIEASKEVGVFDFDDSNLQNDGLEANKESSYKSVGDERKISRKRRLEGSETIKAKLEHILNVPNESEALSSKIKKKTVDSNRKPTKKKRSEVPKFFKTKSEHNLIVPNESVDSDRKPTKKKRSEPLGTIKTKSEHIFNSPNKSEAFTNANKEKSVNSDKKLTKKKRSEASEAIRIKQELNSNVSIESEWVKEANEEEIGFYSDSDCESRAEWMPEEYAEYKFKYSAKKLSKPQVYRCKICLKTQASYYKLNKHMKEHKNVENPYGCPQCESSFPNVDDLTAHLRVHKGKHAYSCKKCDRGFWSRQALDEHKPVHVLKKAKQPNKRFGCETCGKQFGKLCDLERHTRVHTGEKPCVCNICNKRFQQAHNLSKHLLTHLQVKPFHCEICGKRFGRVDVLDRHLLTHSMEKPIKCEACPKSFIRQTQLNNHMRKKHPVVEKGEMEN